MSFNLPILKEWLIEVCSLKVVVHIRKCCVASFIAEGEKINAYVSYHVATGSIQSKVFALNVTVYKTIAFDWANNSIQKKKNAALSLVG